MDIPANLPSTPSLFIVGFTKASRSQTSDWSRHLRTRNLAGPFSIYNVVVLEDVPGLFRGFVIRGIRDGMAKPVQRHFLIVTQQSNDWKTMTAYSENDSDAAYLVLTDADHRIVWHGSKPFSEKGLQVLLERINAQVESKHPIAPIAGPDAVPVTRTEPHRPIKP